MKIKKIPIIRYISDFFLKKLVNNSFFALILLFYFLGNSYAQSPFLNEKSLDNLNSILKSNKSDSIKALANFDLARLYIAKDTALTQKYLKQGFTLSRNNNFLLGSYYTRVGYLYHHKGEYAKSKVYYKRAISYLETKKNIATYKILSDIWSNLAVIEQIRNDDEKFTELILNNAIPLAKKAKDNGRLGSLNMSLGVGFMNLNQNDKAANYFIEAEKLISMADNSAHRLAALYNKMVENYLILGKSYYAEKYLEKSRQLLNQHPSAEQQATYFFSEGFFYYKTHQFKEALFSFDKGIELSKGANKKFFIFEIQNYRIKTLINLKEFEKALNEVDSIYYDLDLMSTDANKLSVYKFYTEIYKHLGDFSLSLEYLEKYNQLSHKINEQNTKFKINQLEALYNDEAKQNEILTLKNKQQTQDLELNSIKKITFIAVIGLLTFLFISGILYFYYRSNKKLILEKEKTHLSEIKKVKIEQNLSVANAVIEGQENERRRVAKELHDGIGGRIAAISYKVSSTENNFELKTELDKTLNELRQISRNLMPESLLKTSLKTSLKDLCNMYVHENQNVFLQVLDVNEDIENSIKLNIYRIIQELLSNATKYAKAKEIIVQVSQNEDIIYITVEDNGIGFEIEKQHFGLGLTNIKNRVAYLNGNLEIDSVPNQGTSINIQVSIHKNIIS